jgi:CheY-like chemotaxis protein
MPMQENVTRILIVDDDDDDRHFFATTIKELEEPHEVYEARSGSALFTMLGSKPLPHVIFLDINMPLPDGFEILQQLKGGDYRHLPVFMYSISSRAEDVEKAYAGGAHHYVVKPHVPTNLKATLQHALQSDWRKPHPIPQRSDFVINIAYSEG